jgi:hypothetical protein
VTSDYGVVSGNMVNGIPAGQSVTLTCNIDRRLSNDFIGVSTKL